MDIKFLNKALKPVSNQKGAVLVFVVLMFALMTIIGTSMVASSARNHGSAVVNRQSESAYYIAEAGINSVVNEISKAVANYKENNGEFVTVEAFFEEFKDVYDGYSKTYSNFEPNNGVQPQAGVTVSHVSTGAKSAQYKIKSTGTIGQNKRTVSTVINVGWDRAQVQVNAPNYDAFKNVFINGSKFTFPGNIINGIGGTVISGSLFAHDLNGGSTINVTNLYFNGPVNIGSGGATIGSETHPGKIHVNGDLTVAGGVKMYGDIYVTGNLYSDGGATFYGKVFVQGKAVMDNGTFNNDVYIAGNTKLVNITSNYKIYVGGNLEVGWTPKGSFTTYYKGTLTKPATLNGSFIKVTSIPDIPASTIPTVNAILKNDQWFSDNGYTSKNGNYNETNFLEANTNNHPKLFVRGDYKNSGQTKPNKNIFIISKEGNITIEGGTNNSNQSNFVTGVLIAPNGKVNLNGWSFNGIIISKDGFYSTGWTVVNMRQLSDFFPDEKDIPFLINSEGGPGPIPGGGATSGGAITTLGAVTAGVTVNSPIKEE